MRYRFYVAENKIICVSTFAGKPVRGIAKCDPKDTFDFDTGKKLAKARCDYKVAEKRVKRARERHAEATKLLGDAREYRDKMQNYYDDAFKDFCNCHAELEAVTKSVS